MKREAAVGVYSAMPMLIERLRDFAQINYHGLADALREAAAALAQAEEELDLWASWAHSKIPGRVQERRPEVMRGILSPLLVGRDVLAKREAEMFDAYRRVTGEHPSQTQLIEAIERGARPTPAAKIKPET